MHCAIPIVILQFSMVAAAEKSARQQLHSGVVVVSPAFPICPLSDASFFGVVVSTSGPGSRANAEMQFRELDLNKTLYENGIEDETAAYESVDLPSDFHVPVLHVYWNDDLTVA